MNEHELQDLYREIILDHYRSPRNRGELPIPPAVSAEGFNPLCGDEVKLFIEVENNSLKEIKFQARGCSISQSSASLMTQAVKGKTIDEIEKFIKKFKAMMSIHEATLTDGTAQSDTRDNEPEEPVNLSELGEVAALQGVVRFPVRIKCAVLAWNTLKEALSQVT